MKKSNVVRMSVLVGAVFAGSVSALADADVTLSGSFTSDKVVTCATDTRVKLNGVNFHDCQLRLTGSAGRTVTFTLDLGAATTNVFLIDGKAKDVNCAAINTTGNLVIDGTGKLKITSEKKMSTDGGVVVCNDLTVRGGSTSVTFDKDKSKSPCMLVRGNYLQTGGKMSVDLKKKNCTNEFYGVQMDTKNKTFTIENGEFEAEIAGSKSRAIDLKKSCTALFRGGKCSALFEGPEGRFVSGGNIVIEGGKFNFATNITGKMTAAYYPVDISAVKASSSVEISGGDFEVDLPLEGSEAITNDGTDGTSVTISGGTFDLVAGNDCIHANGDIVISGGRIRAVSTGDDAIDANGSLTISGGDIRAYAMTQNTHGLDVNNGKLDGVKKTLTISGGTVIATDGPGTVMIGTAGSDEVGKVNFRQDTYYGKISPAANYSQKYLLLNGRTNGVDFVVKPCLPALSGSDFNLLVSVPGYGTAKPTAKTASEAYADSSTACPLVFERKAKVDGQTVTTKEGAVLTLPDYYYLDPAEGKTKTVALYLSSNAVPEIASIAVGSGVTVGVATKKGLYYQLETASDLSGDWVKAGSKVAGDGSEKPFAATRSGSQGFYRAVATDIAD